MAAAIEVWIRRHFSESDVTCVARLLASYGTQSWHREVERVRRDIVITSRGSYEKLKAALELANTDYRDILVGEEVDPWLMQQLKQFS